MLNEGVGFRQWVCAKMASAMVAAATAGRTSWTRRMWAPVRMAAVLAAVVVWRRVSEVGTRVSEARSGARQGVREEAFAGEAGEDGELEGVELVEVGEEGEVFVEDLAEAEAGVEDDLVARECRRRWRWRGVAGGR